MGLFGEIVDYMTGKNAGEVEKNVPSRQDATGKIDIDGNGKPDLIINHDDPRYIESQKTALEMRNKIDPVTNKTYGELLATLDPKKPDDFKKIVGIEKEIVEKVNAKVHEQFGDYDKEVSEANEKRASSSLPDKHGEFNRANTDNPAQLKEFAEGELNCRHYAPLANDLLSQAGMKVTRIFGSKSDVINYVGKNFRGNDSRASKVGYDHTTVMSELTGNIAEFTQESEPYNETFTKITPREFENRVTLPIDPSNPGAIFIDAMPKNAIELGIQKLSIEKENQAIAEEFNKGNKKPFELKINNTPSRYDGKDDYGDPKKYPKDPKDIPEHVKDAAKAAACKDVKCTGSDFTPPPPAPTGQGVAQPTR